MALTRYLTAILTVLIALCVLMTKAAAQPQPSQCDIRAFLCSIEGEWVGVCEQSTDGQQAENKYFHIVNRRVDASTFESKIEYYRSSDTAPLHIGEDSVTIAIGADGTAGSKVHGQGQMLVNKQPKNQSHKFSEVLTYADGGLHGSGSGTISVSGMPFGLGKSGKILSSESTWSVKDGVFTIRQSCKAGFRALFFSKSFKVQANCTATKGSDLASVIHRTEGIKSASGRSSSKGA